MGEDNLDSSEELYRSFIEASDDFVFAVDLEGKFMFANSKSIKMFGDLIGKPYTIPIPQEYRGLIKNNFERRVKGEKIKPYQIEVIDKKGNRIGVEVTGSPLVLKGKTQGVVYFVRDITERRLADEKLRKSGETLHSLFDNIPDIVMNVDREGIIQFINRTQPGIKIEDAIGSKLYDYVEPEHKDKMRKKLEQCFQSGETVDYEILGVGPYGRTSWYESRIVPIKADGEIKHATIITREITERKEAEEALRKSEERLQVYLDSATEAFSLWDSKLNLVMSNKLANKMLQSGTKKADLIGKNIQELVPDVKESGRYDQYLKVIKSGKPLQIEDIVPHPNFGDIRFSLKAFKVDNGLGMIVADITERKKVEEALKKSEEKYKSLVESSLAGVYIVNLDLEYLYLNSKLAEMGGYKIEELMGRSVLDFLTEESAKRTKENMRRWKEKEIESAHFEVDSIRKDGEIITLEVFGRGTIYKGEPAVQGTVLDITEKKRSEEELMKKFMKFKIEKGNSYLIKEAKLDLSRDVFLDLTNCGFSGTILSRRRREDAEETLGKDANIYWIAERKGEKIIAPNFKEIESFIEKLHPRDNVVLLDRLDYLIVKNGFEKTLQFIQKLNELFYLKKWVLIIALDPKTLRNRELSLLENETNIVKSKHEISLDEDIFEILKYVYQLEKKGKKPSYKDVRQKFDITKQTARKRITRLKEKGYVIDRKKGRFKLLELTEDGKDFF